MTLSEKILALRKQAGLSQEELAEKLGVSRQAVSRWEMGSALPDAPNILGLSRLFGVTTDSLLYDEYDAPEPRHADRGPARPDRSRLYLDAAFAVCTALNAAVVALQLVNEGFYRSPGLFLASLLLSVLSVGGFETVCRLAGRQDPAAREKRARFYVAAAWLLTAFPLRELLNAASSFYPWPFPALAFDGLALLAWLLAGCLTMAHFWRELR